jgi:transposase-like protein
VGAKAVVRYSEAFKQQVVEDVERGRFRGAHEAAGAYGVRGHTTVQRWLKESGRGRLVRGVIRVEKAGEPGELKRLKERVRQLETALADAHMDRALDQSFFEILCNEQGIDPEAFKKKHGGEASSRRGRRSRGLQG